MIETLHQKPRIELQPAQNNAIFRPEDDMIWKYY